MHLVRGGLGLLVVCCLVARASDVGFRYFVNLCIMLYYSQLLLFACCRVCLVSLFGAWILLLCECFW